MKCRRCTPYSSSSCEATTTIVLTILSLYGGSAAQKEEKEKRFWITAVRRPLTQMCQLSWPQWLPGGRSFQSLMVLGRNEYRWYWVLHCGCKKCWLRLCRWRGGGSVRLCSRDHCCAVCHSDAGHTGELCPGPPLHLPANGRWDFHLITAAPCHAVQQGRLFGEMSQ